MGRREHLVFFKHSIYQRLNILQWFLMQIQLYLDNMDKSWNCIVITCPDTVWGKILEDTVLKLKNRKEYSFVGNETVIMTAPDPGPNIGSGAATLNALYVAAEYLSAHKNFTAVSADVLQGKNILILNHGREYVYDIGGKGLVSIPSCYTESGIQSNLEHLISFTSLLQSKCQNSGVWVCSTDASLVSQNLPFDLHCDMFKDATVFCVNSDVEYATRHGIVITGTDNIVKEIIYCGSEDYLKRIGKNNQVQILSGIVYLPFNVVENLLNFHTIAPLSNCTYVGIDGGNEPLKISLFFDILVAMIRSPDLTEDDYLSGRYGNLYNLKAGLDQQAQQLVVSARKVIWSHLSKFTLKAVTLEFVKHRYWDERLPASYHLDNLFSFDKMGLLRSIVQAKEQNINQRSLIINSSIECQEVVVGHNSVISNSIVKGGRLLLGNNCYLSNVQFDLEHSDRLSVSDNLVILGFANNDTREKRKIVILGINDDLHNKIDIETDTFCGIIWKEFLKISGLALSDIWQNEQRTLWNAKIFTDQVDINFYLELHAGQYDNFCKLNWKDLNRSSISDMLRESNAERESVFRETLKRKVICLQISHSIQLNTNESFLPFFRLAVSEGWHLDVLDTLDVMAEKMVSKKFEFCRTLSCIADLLGMISGTIGRLRSGPGNNKAWVTAFTHLRNNEAKKAIPALKEMRQKWLSSNLVLRAARHYESALQVFIQNTVKSAKTFISLKECSLPSIDEWVTSECPSRVDLQGGWSDTPPICYEQGGSVVNIALLIDEKRPIGAKVRRTGNQFIHLILVNDTFIQEVKVKSLEDLYDYNQPLAKGALLKAAIVCAELVDLTSNQTLQEQLMKYEGGFEIHCWSHLPQGSGLGTSSILAGCVIAVLWTVSGRVYTKSCLVHAVLYLEQLLTTGGGWQDQVGGIMGGVNRGYSLPNLPLKVQIEPVPIQHKFLKILNKQLFLVYTGKVRLAKNLLQNVIRNWYAREEKVVACFQKLVDNSLVMADAFREEDLVKIGALMNAYWKQKIVLAPGCDPVIIQELMTCLESFTLGQSLAGAGGGGFMCILTKEPSTVGEIQNIISGLPFADTISVYPVTVDTEGIIVKVGNLKQNIF